VVNRITDLQRTAFRIIHWYGYGIPEGCHGYCMSGRWCDFYPSVLFPNKRLDLSALETMYEVFRRHGWSATLKVEVIPGDVGLFMYMHLRMR
jgi:hypothetical protein